jgi:hypothetical protein
VGYQVGYRLIAYLMDVTCVRARARARLLGALVRVRVGVRACVGVCLHV